MKQQYILEFTKDYSVFKILEANRDEDKAHIADLVESIRARDLPFPVIVNEKFEVIDGQHTIEARKQLRKSVPYLMIPGLALADCSMINSGRKNWTTNDFTRSYIKQGNENYRKYLLFKNKFKLPHFFTVKLLSFLPSEYYKMSDTGGGNWKKIFSSGQLIVVNIDGATTFAKDLEKIGEFFIGYKNSKFIWALFGAYNQKTFSFERFMTNLKKNPHALYICARTSQFTTLINEIHNS